MNKKQSKRQRDIKTKLIAAICMLLVSSIMMVSTTYAWFTLSTAPEVTGINTAVGANGNLEMALMPLDGLTASITSGTADSMAVQSAYLANTTWGNLVDLSDVDAYGLDKITLYPAKLNVTEAGDSLATAPLQTPKYGADGRVSELAANTFTGTYSAGKFNETGVHMNTNQSYENAMGVRAVGTSSGMSDRQLAYRAIMSEASGAAEMAQRAASTALAAEGNTLANVAIEHATADVEQYTNADIQSMLRITDALLGTETTKGSFSYIEDALKQYIIAHNLATISDDAYEATQEALNGATLAQLATGEVTGTDTVKYTVNIPGSVGTYITTLADCRTNVTEAKTELSKLTDDDHTWEDIRDSLTKLANPTAMQVNGIPVGELTTGDNMSNLVNSVLQNGLKLTLASGAGVFADIADFCGDYSCTININQISYGGMNVEDVPATMATKTEESTVYLTAAKTAVSPFEDGDNSTASKAMSDFYGYIIDLAFRTNVANSNLQLQADAVDRVYSDGQNPETMGGGASMSFTATTSSFDVYVADLMEHIRVVFFDPSSADKIIGYARLDPATKTQDANGKVTMKLVMTNAAGTATGSSSIMALPQNQAVQLSVLVYLDGETVTNADVSNAAKSMVGTMNLQFSSSATLVPMEYSDLKNGTNDTAAAKTVRLNNVNSSALGVGVTYAAYNTDKTIGILFDTNPTGDIQATLAGKTYDLSSVTINYGGTDHTGYTFTPDEGVALDANTRIILAPKSAATPTEAPTEAPTETQATNP